MARRRDDPTLLPEDTPEEVRESLTDAGRTPEFDPTLGLAVPRPVDGSSRPVPPHRLVALGDSLTHGFQSGAVFATDLSWPAVVAHELGWRDGYRYPRYPGFGGLPFNLELLLRELEERYGAELSVWEMPGALFRARQWADRLEDHWERGAGARAPLVAANSHALAMYGWDLRDVLSKTAQTCQQALAEPKDDLLAQVVENHAERAALRVYPGWDESVRRQTLLDAARALGDEGGEGEGIETLVVFLGANNCLGSVTRLRVAWSGPDFADLVGKTAYTVWRPEHFRAEYAELVESVAAIRARHVIWCTVPHVTIAPIARGLGAKVRPGSRYFPYYARPWVAASAFNPRHDPHLTAGQARAVDAAVDLYNTDIEEHVRRGRQAGRDWYLLDVAGLLDRLAARRYIDDPNARPAWWTPYPLPPELAALRPVPDSRFLTGDGRGGRATGGLFSLDGVHPTTVCYGLIAQEVLNVMRLAGVEFRSAAGAPRTGPVNVDMSRLLLRDTLVRFPPQLVDDSLDVLAWADEALDWVRRALCMS